MDRGGVPTLGYPRPDLARGKGVPTFDRGGKGTYLGVPPPPGCEQTDTCENSTHRTTYAGGNNIRHSYELIFNQDVPYVQYSQHRCPNVTLPTNTKVTLVFLTTTHEGTHRSLVTSEFNFVKFISYWNDQGIVCNFMIICFQQKALKICILQPTQIQTGKHTQKFHSPNHPIFTFFGRDQKVLTYRLQKWTMKTIFSITNKQKYIYCKIIFCTDDIFPVH